MKTSRPDPVIRQLTVRVPRALYVRAHDLARARHTSVNALVRELLEQLDRLERDRELERAYDLLGSDSGSEVEPFFEAQTEVARRG
jgi:hypothetical protein